MSDDQKKVYLGDAVYLQPDGFGGWWLTTEDGISATNRIYLEPEVAAALVLIITRAQGGGVR